jgi:glycerol-3-phosphate dehydrogenase (NAD(P)+)
VDMPVTEAVNALLEGADVRAVVEALLSRPLRAEAV